MTLLLKANAKMLKCWSSVINLAINNCEAHHRTQTWSFSLEKRETFSLLLFESTETRAIEFWQTKMPELCQITSSLDPLINKQRWFWKCVLVLTYNLYCLPKTDLISLKYRTVDIQHKYPIWSPCLKIFTWYYQGV